MTAGTRERPRVGAGRWAAWIGVWAAALVVFYGVLTPLWMLARLIAWASERRLVAGSRGRGGR